MPLEWERILPVVVSILIIIAVAILREYSRTFAAIAATMPLNIPLGLWIISAGAEDKQAAMTHFSRAVAVNIIPTLVFILITWQASKAGWGLLPVIGAGYVGWAVTLGIVFWAKTLGG